MRQVTAFDSLPAFVRGYVEALFFTSDEELGAATFDDIAPDTLAQIVADCDAFLAALPVDAFGRTWLDLAADYAPAGYDLEQAGHDFWFTRNGHGVGFWDRGLGAVGDKLSDAARAAGEGDAYLGDDGRVYL